MLPSFTNTLTNVSVPIERDVTFTCNVKNIGHYRVGGAQLEPIIGWALRHYTALSSFSGGLGEGGHQGDTGHRRPDHHAQRGRLCQRRLWDHLQPSHQVSETISPRCVLTSDNVQVGEPGWRGPVHVSDQHWPDDLSVRLAQCPDPPRYWHGPDLRGHHRPGAWGEPEVSAMMMVTMMSGHGEADLSRGGGAETQDRVAERGRGQDPGPQQPPSAQVTPGTPGPGSGYICNSETIRADKWTSGPETRSRYIGWGARTWGLTCASPATTCRPPSASGYICTCNVGKWHLAIKEEEKMSSFSVSPSILPGLSVLGSAPGNPLTLECIVEAYPKPFVVWSFGGWWGFIFIKRHIVTFDSFLWHFKYSGDFHSWIKTLASRHFCCSQDPA